jgi:hypothetical protein
MLCGAVVVLGLVLLCGFSALTWSSAPSLAFDAGSHWTSWWRADRAPAGWGSADAALVRAIAWRAQGQGVDWGELRLAGRGATQRVRVIVVRLAPDSVRFALDTAFADGLLKATWTLDAAPDSAVLALNAGQFSGSLPWGWVRLRNAEFLPPQPGPLSTAVVIDRNGRLRLVAPDSIPALRRSHDVQAAFQSYPTLLAGDGEVPLPLRQDGGVSLTHIDARLAIGELRDGRVVVVLTRFDALGDALGGVPLGLTTPEMAALMGALGCRRAVMLDGGISAQLLVRDSAGATRRWTGIRRVPMGLVAFSAHAPG